MANDIVNAIGTIATAPTSGSVALASSNLNGPFFQMTFTFTAARIPVTDAAASGSSGSLKIFTFNQGAIQMIGSRHDWTAFAEGTALTTAAGDAVFVIALGSVAATAHDGALSGTEVNFGATRAVTMAGGAGTGATTTTGAQTPLDGTATAIDVYINWSGSAATIDANSYIDVTGTFTISGVLLGDD